MKAANFASLMSAAVVAGLSSAIFVIIISLMCSSKWLLFVSNSERNTVESLSFLAPAFLWNTSLSIFSVKSNSVIVSAMIPIFIYRAMIMILVVPPTVAAVLSGWYFGRHHHLMNRRNDSTGYGAFHSGDTSSRLIIAIFAVTCACIFIPVPIAAPLTFSLVPFFFGLASWYKAQNPIE